MCVVGGFHHINFEIDCVGIRLDFFPGGYNKCKCILFEDVGCVYLDC